MSKECCSACGSGNLTDFFEVENLPVDVGILLEGREQARQAERGDVKLAYCHSCGFVFNRIHDASKVIFKPGYEAYLVHSPIFRAFLDEVADRLLERFDLRHKTILEIGCGSGYFLELLCRRGNNHGIGIDPSIKEERTESVGGGTVRLIRDRFSARHLELDPDFICCQSVFEDFPEPGRFLADLRRTIGERRIGVYFEVFNAFHAFRNRETWSINYEQCNYFGLRSLTSLFRQSGFEVLEAGECYEGGQYIYVDTMPVMADAAGDATADTAEDATADATTDAAADATADAKADATADATAPSSGGSAAENAADSAAGNAAEMPPELHEFGVHHRQSMSRWQERFRQFAAAGRRVVVWGSGCKGINFLNAIDANGTVGHVVDINPDRQGRHIPCAAQEVISPDSLPDYRPDVIIITNALYEREIRRQVAELGMSCEFFIA